MVTGNFPCSLSGWRVEGMEQWGWVEREEAELLSLFVLVYVVQTAGSLRSRIGCAHLSVTAKEEQVYSERRQQGVGWTHRKNHELAVWVTHDLSMSQMTRPDVLQPHPTPPLSLSNCCFSRFCRSRDQKQNTNMMQRVDLASPSVKVCSFLCCFLVFINLAFFFFLYIALTCMG